VSRYPLPLLPDSSPLHFSLDTPFCRKKNRSAFAFAPAEQRSDPKRWPSRAKTIWLQVELNRGTETEETGNEENEEADEDDKDADGDDERYRKTPS
jgi:hypothetical protein